MLPFGYRPPVGVRLTESSYRKYRAKSWSKWRERTCHSMISRNFVIPNVVFVYCECDLSPRFRLPTLKFGRRSSIARFRKFVLLRLMWPTPFSLNAFEISMGPQCGRFMSAPLATPVYNRGDPFTEPLATCGVASDSASGTRFGSSPPPVL